VPELRKPLYATRPEIGLTLGPEVAELCAASGFAPDPEQELILDAVFAIGEDGKAACFEVGVVAPRQAMKTGVFKMCALGWLYVTDQRLILWSAHEYDTAKEAHRDLAHLVTAPSNPHLSKRLARSGVKWANGDEGIELADGARLKFKARTKAGGRGFTGHKLVLDEAFALREEHIGAMLPALASVPDPQVLYGSSAGMSDSTILHALRKRGMAGSPRLGYFEWGDRNPHKGCASQECDHALTAKGCALDDVARWEEINPAFGRRATEESIRSMRLAMPPEQFAREFMVWWDEPLDDEGDLSVEAWAATLDKDARPGDPLVLAVDTAPNGRWTSIVACGSWKGRPTLEVVDRRPGTEWAAARLAELKASHRPSSIALDPAGPVASLLPALEKAGIEWKPIDGKDSVRACGAMVTTVDAGGLWHRDDEGEFAAAVAGAKRRAVGDAWKWSRKDSGTDISPLVAATVALWVHMTADADYDVLSSFY